MTFIALEGVDGAGKTTLAFKLKEALNKEGYTVTRIHEPGGTSLGDKINTLLKEFTSEELTPFASLYMYTAARVAAVEQVIKPALSRGEVVIADRFVGSSFAYQGVRVDHSQIEEVHETACGKFYPDITFWIDITDDMRKRRMEQKSDDRRDQDSSDYYQEVRRRYHMMWAYNRSWVQLDGSYSADALVNKCLYELKRHKFLG